MNDQRPLPLAMIAGMQINKDMEGYFTSFAGITSIVYATAADHDGAASQQEVAEAATRAGLAADTSDTLKAAIEKACGAHESAPLRILIAGSLYLAGEVLRENS